MDELWVEFDRMAGEVRNLCDGLASSNADFRAALTQINAFSEQFEARLPDVRAVAELAATVVAQAEAVCSQGQTLLSDAR